MTKREMVDSAAFDVIRTPPGGWGETRQAWIALIDLAGSEKAADRAVERMTAKYPDAVHPDRTE